MTVRSRSVVIIAAVTGAIAGPVTTSTSAETLAATTVETQAVSRATDNAGADTETIDLKVTRTGSLAMTLTWSGGSGPYDVLIDPSKGEGRYESDIDDTSLTTATEPDRDYCFEVFGSDGSQSGRECVSTSR
jgi:hypothetical protein